MSSTELPLAESATDALLLGGLEDYGDGGGGDYSNLEGPGAPPVFGDPVAVTDPLAAVNRSLYNLTLQEDIDPDIWDSKQAFIDAVALKLYMVPPAILVGILAGAFVWVVYLLSLRGASKVKKDYWLHKEKAKAKAGDAEDGCSGGDDACSSGKLSSACCSSIELQTVENELGDSGVQEDESSSNGGSSSHGDEDNGAAGEDEDEDEDEVDAKEPEPVKKRHHASFRSRMMMDDDSSLPSSAVPSPCLERTAIIIHDEDAISEAPSTSSSSTSGHSSGLQLSSNGGNSSTEQVDSCVAGSQAYSKRRRAGHGRQQSIGGAAAFMMTSSETAGLNKKKGNKKHIQLNGYVVGGEAGRPRRSSSSDSSRYRSFEDEKEIHAIKRCEDQSADKKACRGLRAV